MNLLPYDWGAISYLGITGVLILIFHKNVVTWYLSLIIRVFAIACIGLLSLIDGALWAPWQFLRDWYPLATIALFYFEMGQLTQLVFKGYFDDAVIRWERRIFRGMPCVAFSDRFPSLLLSEFFHLCYFSYYIVAIFLAAWLYFQGKTDAFQETVFAETLTFNLSLLCYPFLPTTGPRYHFAKIQGKLAGGFFFKLTHAILSKGSSKGTAFPSSHVSLSVIVLLCAFRYDTSAFLILLPLCTGLTLGTVYGGFHYAIDALAGAILAILVFVCMRLYI